MRYTRHTFVVKLFCSFFLDTFWIRCLHLAIFLFAARHSNCLCVSVIFTKSAEAVRSNFASLVGNFGESGADPRVPAHCDYVWRRVHSHERRARAHLNPELMADASSLCLSILHHCMILQTRTWFWGWRPGVSPSAASICPMFVPLLEFLCIFVWARVFLFVWAFWAS